MSHLTREITRYFEDCKIQREQILVKYRHSEECHGSLRIICSAIHDGCTIIL